MRISDLDGQASLFGPDSESGKTCRELSPAAGPRGRTSKRSSRHLSGLKNHTLMLLDLHPDAGNMLGSYWEYDPVWLGPPGTLNTSECPKGVVESSLSLILQDTVPFGYYLTRIACLGILRRSEERGKPLPPELETALLLQAGLLSIDGQVLSPMAFTVNQRDEARTLWNIAGALGAQPGIKQQTFVTAGFCAGAGASAGSLGYQEELAPTLKSAQSGSMMPAVLCLNDQGGGIIDWSEDMSGTLRAQEHGHQPLVFENHGVDARYTGPHPVSPTLSARAGTGGNNLPLALQAEEVFCITGNAIDRQPQNGGNGIGIQLDIAYTLTATDHHAVFSRQRVDVFRKDEIASTESTRQYKDATDLICQPGDGPAGLLIRRLTPLECERLQGFPDGWTALPGASDSVRYKTLGNSVAISCVEYIMRGIAMAQRDTDAEQE